MKINTNRDQRNISHARCWLNRAMKDFSLFKKIVPFDKRSNKPIRCSDPALAVYLLQQSVEKAVKAAVIASGQYKTRNFIHYYKHNSLALIMNLNNKIVAQSQAMGLGPVANMMGIDLADGESGAEDRRVRPLPPARRHAGQPVLCAATLHRRGQPALRSAEQPTLRPPLPGGRRIHDRGHDLVSLDGRLGSTGPGHRRVR